MRSYRFYQGHLQNGHRLIDPDGVDLLEHESVCDTWEVWQMNDFVTELAEAGEFEHLSAKDFIDRMWRGSEIVDAPLARGTVVIISCSNTKQATGAHYPYELYTSQLFQKSCEYGISLEPAAIFVLSAKHGLMDNDTKYHPYNRRLNPHRTAQWSVDVLVKLRARCDMPKCEFIFLAGKDYRAPFQGRLEFTAPMEGLGIGKQLRFLTEAMLPNVIGPAM